MSRKGLLHKNVQSLLENERAALLVVIVLMLLPYTAWLSLSVLALVTLRNGWRQGLLLVVPAFSAHVIVLLFSAQLNVALLDGVIRVLPCYVLAFTLGYTRSWRAVAVVFALMSFVTVVALQCLTPELIANQFTVLKLMVQQTGSGAELLNELDAQHVSVFLLSNVLVGIQLLCLFASIVCSLAFARKLQADLYYPGGFKREMLNFRGEPVSLLVAVAMVAGVYSKQAVALNCLPLLLFYFVLAGLSLGAYVLSPMKSFRALVLLCVPCLVLPKVVLPFYMVLGGLDSVFNFRLYLKGVSRCK